MVERPGKDLSVLLAQCRACGRGALGGLPPQARRRGGRSGGDAPHRRRLHLELPFYGSRRMTFRGLNKEGPGVQPASPGAAVGSAGDGDRRRWISRAPVRAKPRPEAQDIPYLLRGLLKIVEPNHVWAADADLHPDGVRLPLSGGDHRLGQPGPVLAWRLSNTN